MLLVDSAGFAMRCDGLIQLPNTADPGVLCATDCPLHLFQYRIHRDLSDQVVIGRVILPLDQTQFSVSMIYELDNGKAGLLLHT